MLLPSAKPKQLTINGHGQETCGIPFEQVADVMKWLGLSLMAAGYEARAHIIWDRPEFDIPLDGVLRKGLKRYEPTCLYRCGDRPMQPPTGYYWRLMPEYPTLRMYQLELTGKREMAIKGHLSHPHLTFPTNRSQVRFSRRSAGFSMSHSIPLPD